jgi:hypothetical protein
MCRRQLKALWKRLGQLQQMKLNARNLLLKLGEAKGRYPAAWRLVDIRLPEPTAEGNATFGGLQVRVLPGAILIKSTSPNIA